MRWPRSSYISLHIIRLSRRNRSNLPLHLPCRTHNVAGLHPHSHTRTLTHTLIRDNFNSVGS
jgi:hypothetical protein